MDVESPPQPSSTPSGAPATTRCGVVGSPIGHSLSPAMHRAAYAALGLSWRYDAHEVPATTLESFVTGLEDSWRGLSVTAPLKREAFDLADEHDPASRDTEVANTLIFDHETSRVSAHNTDVPGALAALRERGVDAIERCVILGAGATAVSMMHSVRPLGVRSIVLAVRQPARASEAVEVARELGLEVDVVALDATPVSADLLISSVPGQGRPDHADAWADASAAVFDVAYDPWPSPLVAAALDRGRPAVTGLDLLAHQAALQVELMTGAAVDVRTLRDAASTTLEP